MRILIWITLLIAVVAAASGQSGKQTSAPARSATLPADIYPDSLNRLPVVKREQMDENGKQVYDHVAGGAGKIASPTGPASIELYSPGAAEPPIASRAQTGFRHVRESRGAIRKTRDRGVGYSDGRLYAEWLAARRFRPAPPG